jgi:alcohol dehydrogenase
MKIRAAVLTEMGRPTPYARSKPLAIETVELDPPGPGEVLVKLAAAGLCHSDLSAINGTRPWSLPMVVGHEAAGIVEATGAGIEDLRKGDHVVLVFVPSCGRCLACNEGRPALCDPALLANRTGKLTTGAQRIKRNGAAIYHHIGVSAFAEYAVVARGSVVKIDKELPLDEAALFGCGVLTGVGAVVNTAQVKPGSTVAVVGLGGVGLSALLGAVLAGARRIVAVDLSDERLAFARQIGATDTCNAGGANAVDEIRELTKGGLDYVFEMAGAVKALELAYKITRRGGVTVTAGLPPPSATLAIPVSAMVAEGRTVMGSYMGSCVPLRDIPHYIELYRRGKLPVDRLMSGHLKLEEINEGFDRLDRGEAIRQVIMF